MKPRIFIGSSVEGKGPAEALQIAFKHDARATVWHQAFGLGGITIDTLLERFRNSDFAVFVFSPDDMARMRESDHLVARDNVVFEAGMFMGMHGRDRTFIVVPQAAERMGLSEISCLRLNMSPRSDYASQTESQAGGPAGNSRRAA
jgi:predicted nucleotide-binding protein